MKKSEALKTLGLSDGATDDEVKQAHRKLVIAHHPDKFPLESKERAEAEELTKRINEARDVLLNRSWTPEFDPRRDPRPYAGNPYAHPAGSPRPGAPQGEWDPFADWPFGAGQPSPFGQGQPTSSGGGRTTYVWTSWDGSRTAGGQTPGGMPFDFDPFDPFAPFRSEREQQKTPQERLDEARSALGREAGIVAAKAAALVVLALVGSVATGLFLYVVVSFVYGLWKRFGSCLIGLLLPLALFAMPLVFLIAPRQGAVTIGLAVFFLAAVLFDVSNLRSLAQAYRTARSAAR